MNIRNRVLQRWQFFNYICKNNFPKTFIKFKPKVECHSSRHILRPKGVDLPDLWVPVHPWGLGYLESWLVGAQPSPCTFTRGSCVTGLQCYGETTAWFENRVCFQFHRDKFCSALRFWKYPSFLFRHRHVWLFRCLGLEKTLNYLKKFFLLWN